MDDVEKAQLVSVERSADGRERAAMIDGAQRLQGAPGIANQRDSGPAGDGVIE